MTRTANATSIVLYAAAIPLLAGLSDETVDRLALLAGRGTLEAAAAAPISDEQAVELALAATRANHRPAPLTTFAPYPDAETDDNVTVLASLN